MRWIYLSPHLDDVILSCGGLIREQTYSKTQVEIWTICAGDPPSEELSAFAQTQHANWGIGMDASTLRRNEDIAACRIVGARYRHLPFLDCIYRQSTDGSWLYPSEESIFGEQSLEDAPTIFTLRTFLATILKTDDILVIPLSVGNHVDHQWVRMAAEELKQPMFYYADAPYIMRHPEKISEAAQTFQSQIYNFPLISLAAWQDASQVYGSQLGVLFGGVEKMRSSINLYYQKENGIRLWMPVGG